MVDVHSRHLVSLFVLLYKQSQPVSIGEIPEINACEAKRPRLRGDARKRVDNLRFSTL